VHDLDFEDGRCQIDELIKGGNYQSFPTLGPALAEGYEECGWCK
jgi:hypothetical protein